MNAFLRAENVSSTRELRGGGLSFVREVSLDVERGQFITLCGAEGCGKNLLLRLLGLLETPDAGEIFLNGSPVSALGETERLELRNSNCGYVFTEPFLLNTLSVVENIAMPLFKISGVSIEDARARTAAMLDFIGLARAAESPVDSLSLLDQHKVSLARALANRPQILLVESTDTQLSEDESSEFLHALARANETFSVTVLLAVSHAAALPNQRVIEMADGRIVRDLARSPVVI